MKFHILDIVARDEIIEHEDEETREVSYAADDDYANEGGGAGALKPRALKITLFGKTAVGQAVRVNVAGFKPFFYVRLPDRDRRVEDPALSRATYGSGDQRYKAIAALRTYLVSQGLDGSLFEIAYEEKRTFFGYNARASFPFARISVQSLDYFRKAKNCFLDYKTSKPALKGRGALAAPFRAPPKVFEANLDPMLRFFHLRNIDPCGWAAVSDEEEPTSIDAECAEYDCDWESISPATGAIAPFTIASWDIETYSVSGDFTQAKMTYRKVAKELYEQAKSVEHAHELLIATLTGVATQNEISPIQPKGKRKSAEVVKAWLSRSKLSATLATHCAFSLPGKVTQDSKKEHITAIAEDLNAILDRPERLPLEGDPVIQIGTILATTGRSDLTERHVFVWPSCDPIEGVVVHECTDEAALIADWAAWMQERNPDVLVGYNVFGFDEKYISDRADELGIADCEELQGLNRLHTEGSTLSIRRDVPDFKIEEKFLSSSALGDNFMHIWTMWGRLQVDLYHHVKRNAVLPSYKLDEVAKTYMSGKFDAIEYRPTEGALVMKVKGSAVADAKPGRYICLLDTLGETITEKLPILRNEGGFIHMKYAPAFGEDDDEQWRDAAKWVIVKDDMPYDELFACHTRGPADRAKVAAYCVQDCELVLDLYNKLDVFNTSMAMANVCTVPIGYIFTRGQGIKIESLMFKEAFRQGQAVEVLESPIQRSGKGIASQQQESYEGAIVLDPTIGLLDSPVGVADFASLYPSTIVSENISHDTLVWVKDFDHDGYLIRTAWGSDEYDKPALTPMTDIEFDLLIDDPEDHRKVKRKVSIGKRICRYAQDGEGTVPQIIKRLLAARKATRALIPKTQDPLKAALLDAQQNAYKITANSLYGQLGSGTFKLRLQHLAASVTGYGRKQILFAKEVIETFYGEAANNPRCSAKSDCKVVYGDSVTGDTAIFIKKIANDTPLTARIDELFPANDVRWEAYHDTKEAIQLEGDGMQIWTEKGFTTIKRLIRHRLAPEKKLYRLVTHTGVVDATDDHSLVLANGKEATPKDAIIGTELLHNHDQHTALQTTDTTISENEAWVMGFFMADGSADVYDCPSGRKATWAINKLDHALLEHAQTLCPFNTKILNTVESSGVYKLVLSGENTTKIATRYRAMFYNQHREKKVPACILNAPTSVLEKFWEGFYAGDGDKDVRGYCRFDQKGKEVCLGLYLIARRLGYSVSINDRASKPDVFRLTMTKSYQRKNPNAIKTKYEITANHQGAYVYDFETENHHFAVGPGALVVHNTDSLFVQFNPHDPETGTKLEGRDARLAVIELTAEAGHLVTQTLKAPHDFEFDKVFDPLLMFSKKRYAGRMHENADKPDDFVYKYMGIALKRRDNAPLVKNVYGAAMKKVLDEKDVEGACATVKEGVRELIEGRVPLTQLCITKSLRAEYANPLAIAHKVLADRITARDPGNAPAAGDRMAFAYVLPTAGQEPSKLQGDRIETPQYIRDNKLALDYRHYIQNQLKNPISQMFALLLEQMPGYTPALLPAGYDQLDEDHKMAMRERIAGDLLFGEFIDFLDRHEAIKKKSIFASLLGATYTPMIPVLATIPKMRTGASGAAQALQKSAASRQPTMDEWFSQVALHKKIDTTKRKAAAAAAATASTSH
jgi:DNA polymerase elongation subunit (family B)